MERWSAKSDIKTASYSLGPERKGTPGETRPSNASLDPRPGVASRTRNAHAFSVTVALTR